MPEDTDRPPLPETHEEPPGPEDSITDLSSARLRFKTPPRQTGDAAPTQIQQDTPVTMSTSGILLDDHDVPSVSPYVYQDLLSGSKSDLRDWCQIVLGKDEASLDVWKLKIKQLKWFHDEMIQQAFVDYCTLASETQRYKPFARLANRLLSLARGNLPGVPKKNSYPIDDICFEVHADRPVFPTPEHGILAAERKPDIVLVRKADCDTAPKEKGKMKLRWPQIISFMEFKSTRNLRADLDSKRTDEGLPFIWQRVQIKKRRRKGKRSNKKRPSMRNGVGKIQPPIFRPIDPANAESSNVSAQERESRSIHADMNYNATIGRTNHNDIDTEKGDEIADTINTEKLSLDTEDIEDMPGIVRAGMKRKRDSDDPVIAMKDAGDLRRRDSHHPRVRTADAAVQTGSYALELMSGTRGTRTSCFSASVKDDRVWFWHYDPTGVLYTNTSISMIDDFEYFSSIIVAIASCSAERFGALPSNVIQSPDDGPTTLLKENLCGHKLILNHPETQEPVTFTFTRHVFTQYGLTGRRTFVYEAKMSPVNELPEVIIKCSYQASGRRPEHKLIDHARKHQVSHLPDVHMWGDIWTLEDVARQNYRLAKKKLREGGKALVEPQYEDRIFRVIVYSRYYSLRTLLSKHIELLPAVINQVLDCLHDLRYKANILHRDISVNNIMWKISDNALDVRVIDFDIANVDDRTGDYVPSSKHRSGTLPFMAPDLLLDAFKSLIEVELDEPRPPVKHLLRHDIVSLFYVSMWCVEILLADQLTPEKQQHMRSRAKKLESGGLEGVADHKQKLLTADFGELCLTLPESAKCLRNWLKRFHEVLGSAYWDIAAYKRFQSKAERHPDDSDDEFSHTDTVPFNIETAGGRLTKDYLQKKLSFYIPPQTCTITAADIERECIPEEKDSVDPSIPLELRKPIKDAKAGKKKGRREVNLVVVEDRRARLRPRKNGRVVAVASN